MGLMSGSCYGYLNRKKLESSNQVYSVERDKYKTGILVKLAQSIDSVNDKKSRRFESSSRRKSVSFNPIVISRNYEKIGLEFYEELNQDISESKVRGNCSSEFTEISFSESDNHFSINDYFYLQRSNLPKKINQLKLKFLLKILKHTTSNPEDPNTVNISKDQIAKAETIIRNAIKLCPCYRVDGIIFPNSKPHLSVKEKEEDKEFIQIDSSHQTKNLSSAIIKPLKRKPIKFKKALREASIISNSLPTEYSNCSANNSQFLDVSLKEAKIKLPDQLLVLSEFNLYALSFEDNIYALNRVIPYTAIDYMTLLRDSSQLILHLVKGEIELEKVTENFTIKSHKSKRIAASISSSCFLDKRTSRNISNRQIPVIVMNSKFPVIDDLVDIDHFIVYRNILNNFLKKNFLTVSENQNESLEKTDFKYFSILGKTNDIFEEMDLIVTAKNIYFLVYEEQKGFLVSRVVNFCDVLSISKYRLEVDHNDCIFMREVISNDAKSSNIIIKLILKDRQAYEIKYENHEGLVRLLSGFWSTTIG